MGFVDDFVQLPPAFKYVVAWGVLAVGSVPLPIIKFSLGNLLFAPFNFVLANAKPYPIYIDFAWTLVLFSIILLVQLVHAFEK